MNIRQAAEPYDAQEQQLWGSFAQPRDGAEFLSSWLALTAAQIGGVEAGALILHQPDGSFAPAALWPHDPAASSVPAMLAEIAEQALRNRRGTVRSVEAGALLAYPFEIDGAPEGVVALALSRHPGPGLATAFRRIHWATGWLQAAALRTAQTSATDRLNRAAGVLQALAALEEEQALSGALAAFCSEIASRFGADRVSLGLRPGFGGQGRVRLAAMSNAAWFQKRSALVRAIETAQSEALLQASVVAAPAPPGERQAIDAAHRRLAAGHGAAAVMTLPLQDDGRIIGAVTIERFGRPARQPSDDPLAPGFDAETAESLKLAAALVGPVIGLKRRNHRWLGGRLRDGAASWLARLFGRRHPALKLATLAIAGTVLALALARGELRSSAKATLEGAVQRAVVAPFQGFIAEAPVRAGERVEAGRMLARLDDRDLRFERLKWESERVKAEQRQRESLAKADRAGVLVAAAQIGQAQAELALVDEKLQRTRLTAPLEGLVVSGDLSQMLGAPVEQGKVLFEIAPLDEVRIVLQVPEGDYRLVAERFEAKRAAGEELHGTLVLTGEADRQIPFRVSALTPVSTPQDGRNSFRVEAGFRDPAAAAGLRPGMEGIGKIDLGEARLLWIWARPSIDRLRLLAWSWLP